MSQDLMGYNGIVEEALKGVVRESLIRVARDGLPGEHHFYISFRTDVADVQVPAHLRMQYPKEITIVLQHQYWDLEVGERGFSVTLAFAGRNERLAVPFSAITGFADPSVQFGLQFKTAEDATSGSEREDDLPAAIPEDDSVEADFASFPAAETEEGRAAPLPDDAPGTEPSSADVVVLDRFRNK
jgi:hypothetical protein